MTGFSTGLRPESHYGLPEYSSRAPAEIGSYKPHLDYFINLVNQNSQSDDPIVADVAAGPGVTSEELLNGGLNVTAIDASPHALFATHAKKVCASFLEWNHSTGISTIDGIHSKDFVGIHIAPRLFLDECSVVLKPGGILMCTYGRSDILFINAIKDSQGYKLIQRKIWEPDKGELDWNDGYRRAVYALKKI